MVTDKKIYNRLLHLIGNEVKTAIKEQFSISDLDFTDDMSGYDANIFNKNILDINRIYNDLLNGVRVNDDEIRQLNDYNSVFMPVHKNELKQIIIYYSEYYPNESLNWLDVSRIADMSYMFRPDDDDFKYNGDISNWDVSNVISMSFMFTESDFNNDISRWDVSNVTEMTEMFENSIFN